MLMKNKKSIALLIAGGPKHDQPEAEQHQEDPNAQYHAAAEEIMNAFHSKDASALADALKSFVSMCDSEEEPSEEPSEPPQY